MVIHRKNTFKYSKLCVNPTINSIVYPNTLPTFKNISLNIKYSTFNSLSNGGLLE